MDTTANLEEVARRLSPSTPPAPRSPLGPKTPLSSRSSPLSSRSTPLSPVSALCRDLHELRLEDRTVEEEAEQVAPPISPTVAPRRGRLRELLRGRSSEPLPRELDSDSEAEEEFYTPPSSAESASPATPGQAPEVFIHGRQPSTADLDALRALETTKVDPVRFPGVCNWRSQVLARSRTQGFRFATPRRPTCRPPAVPEGDGASPLARPASSRLPLQLRPSAGINGPR
ncbi:ankyrin repeat and LEM domain-containing protein 2-like [Amphibalanus amphitrite]|uniref:ankyrin repeat and LEM domain-containing protein 2-like n=1 Tax=Amphibalanus amphitrite TaxID=1232801 RepID=UPI001C906098|nr:ankyrin repeat and LEM domain-containing protein 2-like [Amphibalanus amphitrite]